MGRGLKGCKDDDIIIFSDLDEIPNPEEIKKILENFDDSKIYHFAQRLFYCYLNMEEVSGNLLSYAGDFEDVERKMWIGSKMCSYKLIREKGYQLGELRFPQRKEIGIRVNNGGWHFGYMGGHGQKDIKKRVEEKVISAAHQEYNNKKTLNRVKDNIDGGMDIFGRDAKFVQTEIDETYPLYLREHLDEYDFLLKKTETPEELLARENRVRKREKSEHRKQSIKKMIKKLLGRS